MEQRDSSKAVLQRADSEGSIRTRSVVRMLQAISAASIGSGSPEELESAGRNLVVVLRQANEPPEQVLLLIKRILTQAGVRSSYAHPDPTIVSEHHAWLYRSVIDSSIRQYFQCPDNADGGAG